MVDHVDLAALVADATSDVRCWAGKLDGQAAEYVRLLEEAEAAKPGAVNRAQVSRDLRTHFAVTVDRTRVASHFNGGCRCVR